MTNNTAQANALLGLLAETSIHAGAGSSTGVIDLPIQREGHNGWPCIFGSSVKGAFRDAYEKQYGKEDELTPLIFGPDPDKNNADEHAGALAVSDARLLLLPVRSLTSQFKWVTCPAALQRLARDAARLSLGEIKTFDGNKLDENSAIVHTATPNDLFLEEYRFTTQAQTSALSAVIQTLATLMPLTNAQALLEEQLTIVHNDMFTHLATHATPMNAHICIDSETKTVKNGALWYEETLPPETLLYTCISANRARKLGAEQNAEAILGGIKERLFGQHPYLQLGGNETVGMGWCAVKFFEAGEKS